jgi:hypothetical protein
VIGLFFAAVIIMMVRRDMMQAKYSVWWLSFAAVGFLLGFFPNISDWVAKMVGVSYPPTLIITLALVVLAVKNLYMDIERSHLERRVRRLTQRLALYEQELDEKNRSDAGE